MIVAMKFVYLKLLSMVIPGEMGTTLGTILSILLLFLKLVASDDVERAINSLKNDQSSGCNELGVTVVKMISEVILEEIDI